MSTRSRIGYFKNGLIKSVYCHFDGYPEGVGYTLLDHYQDLRKVMSLVSLGSISCLGESVEFSGDVPNGTRDYHRWRGDVIEIETDYGEHDYWNCAFDCGEDYAYLFKDGKWFYMNYLDDSIKRLEKKEEDE